MALLDSPYSYKAQESNKLIFDLGSANPAPSTVKEKDGTNMMVVLIAGVAGGFLVLIIAIVIVCVLMRNIQRNNAKKNAENAEHLMKGPNSDTVCTIFGQVTWFPMPYSLTISNALLARTKAHSPWIYRSIASIFTRLIRNWCWPSMAKSFITISKFPS